MFYALVWSISWSSLVVLPYVSVPYSISLFCPLVMFTFHNYVVLVLLNTTFKALCAFCYFVEWLKDDVGKVEDDCRQIVEDFGV